MMIESDYLEGGSELLVSEDKPKEAQALVVEWAKKLKLTDSDLFAQIGRGSKTFNEGKIEAGSPETDIRFWVKNGVKDWTDDFKGVVLGQKGMMTSRERIGVSKELAKEAARKITRKEKLSKAEEVSSLVWTKAKLEAARALALEWQPGLEHDFNMAENEIDKKLAKLLEDSNKVMEMDREGFSLRISPKAAATSALLFELILSACSGNANAGSVNPIETVRAEVTAMTKDAPTGTATERATSTATSTETSTPTEVPIDFTSWKNADGSLNVFDAEGNVDMSKITNVVPEDPAEQKDFFVNRVKPYLSAEQDKKYPHGVLDGALECDVDGVDSGFLATRVRIALNAGHGTVSPSFLSKDSDGNVVMTFLCNFRDLKTGEWTQKRLVNVVIYAHEYDTIIAADGGSMYHASDIFKSPWGKSYYATVTFLVGLTDGYTPGEYLKTEKQIKKNTASGVTDDEFVGSNAYNNVGEDYDINIDGVVFPAWVIGVAQP